MADPTKPQQVHRRIGKQDIIPGTITQSHMAANRAIITIGLAAHRPTKGNNSCKVYFAIDTHVLSIWTGIAWKATSALT